MNYQALTNDSLTTMYEGVRGALAADDALKRRGQEARFRVRGLCASPIWLLFLGRFEFSFNPHRAIVFR